MNHLFRGRRGGDDDEKVVVHFLKGPRELAQEVPRPRREEINNHFLRGKKSSESEAEEMQIDPDFLNNEYLDY